MESRSSHSAHSSKSSVRKNSAQKLYPPITIPQKDENEVYFPPSFPDILEKVRPVSDVQLKRWQNRLTKLLNASTH